jgi:hypothetical protein
MAAAFGVNQLRSNANAVSAASDAAFEHVSDPTLASDSPDVDSPALILEAGVASYHKQLAESRQLGNYIFHHPISEVLLRRIAIEIGEGKNSD